MSIVSDPLTQLLLLIGTGVLCLGMAAWLRTPRFRAHPPSAVIMAPRNMGPALPTVVVPRAPTLNIDAVVQHGYIVEIKGSTEPGAVVMINGQPVAAIFAGNQFRHFLGPLPKGLAVVSVTCQNEEGGVSTRQMAVNLD
jgi:hypothetical protein